MQIEETLKATGGEYAQILPTLGTETVMDMPPDSTIEPVLFTPTKKDYTFWVHAWTGREGRDGPKTSGYAVVAEKDLGDGVTQQVIGGSLE